MLTFTTSQNTSDLEQILQLQKENLELSLSPQELQQEGFVTVHHDMKILEEMNHPHQHIIAKDDSILIAYALVMLKAMEQKIPVLIPMFQQVNKLNYKGKLIANTSYFVMGQVCIKKGYRGKGIFKGLYLEMKNQMASNFEFAITEVASRNHRSIRAHQKVGFTSILKYTANNGEDWNILIWDWKERNSAHSC